MAALFLDMPANIAPTVAALAAHLGHEISSTRDNATVLQLTGTNFTANGVTQASIPLPATIASLAKLISEATAQTTRPMSLSSGWQFDPSAKRCTSGTNSITLTDKETLLLSALLSGRPVSRDTLIRDIWAHEAGVNSHTLETHIYRLRQKLEPITGLSITAQDYGYILTLA